MLHLHGVEPDSLRYFAEYQTLRSAAAWRSRALGPRGNAGRVASWLCRFRRKTKLASYCQRQIFDGAKILLTFSRPNATEI